ncbi:MAG TPA: cytochrome c biogenesis protein CcsA [Syntrophomonadaceae bacterium]|jgi:ABC-type transport system involved in cytochrome c biogenesis permease subunit|nr:cytochrome c biogenesis protein CcsA [Syntrophomonadaceae bacterium]
MAEQLLMATFILLVLAVLINLARLWSPIIWLDSAAPLPMYLAAALLLVILAWRTAEAGRLPLANMYEFSVFMVLIILLGYFLIRRVLQAPEFDLAVSLLLTMLFAMLASLPSDLRPLMPALQSRWLSAHVATAILAYSAFAIAFCLGIIYLIRTSREDASLKEIDRQIYRMVVWGFALLTLVIITGAVWAEEVWGNWWSWDPKETWSLVTWVVYAAYLHARRTRGWRGRRSAWLVVIGFLVVLFTLYGVSILLPGLHSYA